MITVKKIRTLRPRVQLRKIADVFHEAGRTMPDEEYLRDVLSTALSSELLTDDDRERIQRFFNKGDQISFDDIHYHLLSVLGDSPAEWDERGADGEIDWSVRRVLRHTLFLDHLRSPYNVGAVFRSAEAFCVDRLILAPGTASPEHPRARRTSMGTVDGLLWEEAELSSIDKDIPVFALETGGTDLSDFRFPESGICIIGSEESGISPEGRERALSSMGIVSIPQYGAKGSINVASATAILLYQWMIASS